MKNVCRIALFQNMKMFVQKLALFKIWKSFKMVLVQTLIKISFKTWNCVLCDTVAKFAKQVDFKIWKMCAIWHCCKLQARKQKKIYNISYPAVLFCWCFWREGFCWWILIPYSVTTWNVRRNQSVKCRKNIFRTVRTNKYTELNYNGLYMNLYSEPNNEGRRRSEMG